MKHTIVKSLLACAILFFPTLSEAWNGKKLIEDSLIDRYVEEFNTVDIETIKNFYDNTKAADFLKANIPYFECPDKELERTYYYRWWSYRKHLRKTPDGFVISEFLHKVRWAGKHNAINCPAALQIEEGRWLRDKSIVADYLRYWMLDGAKVRHYSFPLAYSLYQYTLVAPDEKLVDDMYDFIKDNFAQWEKERLDSTGFFWQRDAKDGMECSISGKLSPDQTGYRPTINSYMYADAWAISRFAEKKNIPADAAAYSARAGQIKQKVEQLWDPDAQFYKVIPRHRDMSLSPTREEIGYIPWLYDIPGVEKTVAWQQLSDPEGFYAPYGPTTAERRAEGFEIKYEWKKGEWIAQWNGPSWPYATSQTLGALGCCLRRLGETKWADKKLFFNTLSIYSNSHRIKLEDGRVVCRIDENIDPFTGVFLVRAKSIKFKNSKGLGAKDYNHSSFCDIVISDLVGINPQEDGSILIEPLVPEGEWDYFCLQDVACAGHSITVVYDKTGKKYHKGKGLNVFVDGKRKVRSAQLNSKITIN